MEIEVKLYGTLRQHRPSQAEGMPHHPFSITVPDGTAVETLLAHLEIPDGLVSAAAVNGVSVELTTPLNNGDKVSLFPPAAGGHI